MTTSAASAASNTPPLFPRTALHPAALARADADARAHARSRARGGDAPWCVAFSGGADSLALLLTLRAHFPGRKLVALHFNHHLRAAASDADEKFCRDTCAALGVELRAGHWTHNKPLTAPNPSIPPNPSNPQSAIRIPHSSESAAREARHAFFAREMAALGSRALFLGHQLDDIAETQLMRLARGSGAAGLAAPRPAHERADGRVFLRPLLTLTKKQITAALRARGLAWREDATNAAAPGDPAGDYFRNRIRRDVLPAWLAAAENDALAGAALTRELLDEDATALDAWLDELLPGSACVPPAGAWVVAGKMPALPGSTLDLRPLANKPRALLRRALRRWPPAAELARAGFESLLAICESPTPAQTSIGDATAIFGNGILRLQPSPSSSAFPSFRASVTPPFSLALPDGSSLTAEPITLTPALRARILAGEFSPATTIFVAAPPPQTPLIVRNARPGDRFRPLGAPGSAKLSDLFINRKIPPAARRALPVICAGPVIRAAPATPIPHSAFRIPHSHSPILCVPGLPPADAFKITPKTSQALRLTYHDGTCTFRGQSISPIENTRNTKPETAKRNARNQQQ